MPRIISTILVCGTLISGLFSSYSFSLDQAKLSSNISNNKERPSETEILESKISELSKQNSVLNHQNRILYELLSNKNKLESKNATKEQLIINETIFNELKKLNSQIEQKVSDNTLDILSKSFYERLRTTDDSVSMWGTVTGWFGVLITLVLASMAFLHFGRFRELKSETENVLREAKKNSAMSANAAVTRAGNEAKKQLHNWLNDKGIKEIDRKISEFNQQISIAKDKLSYIDGTLAEANTSISRIKIKEESFQLSPEKDIKKTSPDVVNLLNILPSQRTLDNTLPLVNSYLDSQDFRKALESINNLFDIKTLTKDEELTLNLYKSYTLGHLKLHQKSAIVYLSKCAPFFTPESINVQLTKVNIYLVLNIVVYSLIKIKNYDTAKDITIFALDNILKSRFKYNQIEYIASLAIEIDIHNKNQDLSHTYIPKLIELFSDSDNKIYKLERLRLLSELEADRHYNFDVEKFIEIAKNTSDLINAYILITDHYALTENYDLSINYFNVISNCLTKDQKKHNIHLYIYLLLNRAYSFSRSGQRRKAYRLGSYVKNKSRQLGITFDERGKSELEEALNYNMG